MAQEVAEKPVIECRRCGQTFLQNRKDKFYCSPQCQGRNPWKSRSILDSTKIANRMLTAMDRVKTPLEIAREFEAATGTPYAINLINLPPVPQLKALNESTWEELFQNPCNPREEMGKVWWNVPKKRRKKEQDPLDVEHMLHRQRAHRTRPEPDDVQDQVDAWLAAGGKIKVLPPGRAIQY